jgi:hypothetical protein
MFQLVLEPMAGLVPRTDAVRRWARPELGDPTLVVNWNP